MSGWRRFLPSAFGRFARPSRCPMILLVGLGNPGPKYAGTRHNIGFMAVDEIVRRHDFAPFRRRFQGEASEGTIGSTKVLVLKPQTYMNESGRSVAEAMKFYRLGPEQVIVFHDELDLAPGKLRVKRGGGTAGHNGLRSLDRYIGPDFRRVRLGIGHPGNRDAVERYVLRDFSKADREWLDPLIEAIGRHVDLLVAGDDATFANRVHLAVNPAPRRPEVKRSSDRPEEGAD